MATRSRGPTPAGEGMGLRGRPGREGGDEGGPARGGGPGWCQGAVTVLQGLRVAVVALLGSWPLGVPLPPPVTQPHNNGPFLSPYQQVRGPAGRACAGPYRSVAPRPRPSSEMGRMGGR